MIHHFDVAISYMLKCIRSSEQIEHLIVCVDWIERCVTSDAYRGVSDGKLDEAKAQLYSAIDDMKTKIYGIGHDEPEYTIGTHF